MNSDEFSIKCHSLITYMETVLLMEENTNVKMAAISSCMMSLIAQSDLPFEEFYKVVFSISTAMRQDLFEDQD